MNEKLTKLKETLASLKEKRKKYVGTPKEHKINRAIDRHKELIKKESENKIKYERKSYTLREGLHDEVLALLPSKKYKHASNIVSDAFEKFVKNEKKEMK